MLERIWKSIVRFFQGLFGLTPKPQPVEPPPKINRLSDVEYESLFMQLLDGVYQGWSGGQVKGFLMAKRTTEVDLVAWLQGFGGKLLASPELHLELGQRMVQLGEVGCGKLGEVAAEFGRQLLASVLITEETQETEAWFDQGCDEYEKGNYDVALACFKRTIDDNPNNPQAWEMYGKTLQKLGRISEAIAANNNALRLYRNDNAPTLPLINHVLSNSSTTQEAEAWYDRGDDDREAGNYEQALAWFNQGVALAILEQWEEALACFDKALEFKDDDHEPWDNRGVALGNLGQWEEALSSFNKALEFKGDYHQAWFNRGLVLEKLGQWEDALASHDKALEFKDDFHQAWFNRGMALGNLGQWEEALTSFDKALEFKGDHHEAWFNRGMALGNLGQWEEALTSFDKALEFKDDFHQAWYKRGVVLGNLGQWEEQIASYNKALEFKGDYHEAWCDRGSALSNNLEQWEGALASFDKALEFKGDFHEAWYNRGVTLGKLGQLEPALTSYDKALEFKADYHHAWFGRGNALEKLGQWEEALTSYNKALEFKGDYHNAWCGRGVVLGNLGQWEEEIASYDKALEFKGDYHEAWYNRGNALEKLGQLEPALASFDKALEFKGDYHEAWYNRGLALGNLGQWEEAIASYDKALEFKADDHKAWHNRGVALGNLGQLEQAISSVDKALKFKADFHEAWRGRGFAVRTSVSCDPLLASMSSIATNNPALNQRGYEGELTTYQEGLKYCPQDTHPEGWGRLHQAIGDAHYFQGRRDSRPRPYWHKAVNSYHEALKTLTKEAFPEALLEVLQNLIKVYYDLGQREETEALRLVGSEVLFELLQKTPSNTVKIRLSRKFASFAQWRVNELVQSDNWCAALELAEQHKNLCLGWLRYGWSESVENSPKYAQMQELLQPSTTSKDGEKAVVYWHISPAAITTFILRHKQPPLILSAKADLTPLASLPYQEMSEQNSPRLAEEEQGERFNYPPSRHQLIEFEDWMNTWKKDYQNYRLRTRQRNEENRQETQETPVSSSEQKRWLEKMRERLEMLAKILNLQEILLHLKDVNQLILIPHRDLHLLPLHALFSDNFTITYLPSIKVGLDLKKAKQNAILWQSVVSLLTVENPTGDLRDASLESKLIRRLYPNSQCLSESAATPDAVKEALSEGVGVFHFIGHGEHDLNQPENSALFLANKKPLTCKDIWELDLSRWQLACLSGCETNFTSKDGLIDEFIGLTSAFLAAGVTNVLGSLWRADDCSTAYLMTKFHEILKNPNNSEPPDVASALKKAQNLLRTVTNKELQQWGAQLPLEFSQYRNLQMSVEQMDEEMAENHKPYESPFHWAAFCAIG